MSGQSDVLERAKARLALLRSDADTHTYYEINEIDEITQARQWLVQARVAIETRLSGRVRIADLAELREHKRAILDASPESDQLDEPTLAEVTPFGLVLSEQVDALSILIAALRGEPIDRDRLATHTVREAWRLHRHDVIAAALEGDPWPPRGPEVPA